MKTNPVFPTACITLMMILLPLAGVAQEMVPTMMSYQGRMTAGGTNFNGTGWFKFALVNAYGNTTYWSNDGFSGGGAEPGHSVAVAVADGLFSVMLGDTSLSNMVAMLPEILEMRNDAHLRIWFSEDGIAFTQLAPDQPVGSTLYAMMAARVQQGAIGNGQLANNAVTVSKIANLSVTGAKIADLSVTGAKLAADSVTASKIVNGTITSNKIDWSTMPEPPVLRGYAENGAFATAPVASGGDAIAMGFGAVASGAYASVGGGSGNKAGNYATVGGGASNIASNDYATVSGGRMNSATDTHATVGGGSRNVAGGAASTIAGGVSNRASGGVATVGGGSNNTASVAGATVGGGHLNLAAGLAATVGGGWNNSAISESTTVGGGKLNTASSPYSTVGGGSQNTADGMYSMVPGGLDCKASGSYSFAAGRQAKAANDGSFVWGDATAADFSSTTNNQFRIRANGGFQLVSGGHWDLEATQGDMRIGNDTYHLKIGVALTGGSKGASWLRADGGVKQLHLWAPGGTWVYSSMDKTSGVRVAAGGGSWTSLSDRNAKEAFEPVDPREVLEKVASLPITTWKYKEQDASIRHIGPVAQDFYAAFGVGETNTGIATIDADGVALAAIQGVNQKLEEEVAELKARLERLEALIAGME